MEQFILTDAYGKPIRPKSTSGYSGASKITRIPAETHAVLNDLSRETGLAMGEIVKQCVNYAIRNSDWA